MKKFSIYNKIILSACVAVVGLLSSCSAFDDFLTVYPTDKIPGEQYWEDKNDLESVLFSCYKQFTTEGMSERMYLYGEGRSDNFVPRDASNQNLVDLMNANLLSSNSWFNWATFYKEIGYCNLILSKGMEIVEKDNSFSEGDWKCIEAEVKTLRALAYFYLVRAFRDVPLNTKYNDTSKGARDPMPQASSEEILTFLINDLEEVKDNAVNNYGNEVDNHGRITRKAVYTLLADLYQWRAAKNSSPDSIRVYGDQYKQDYQKCVDCCRYVIDVMNYRFNETGTEHYGKTEADQPELPLLMPESRGQMEDKSYNQTFGEKNSQESIFEIQYSSSTTYNTALDYFFGAYSGNNYQSGKWAPSTVVAEFSGLPDETGWYRTDIRAVETFYRNSSASASFTQTFAKYLNTGITINEPEDLTRKNAVSYEGSRRTYKSNDANFIVYRASDVILMLADALNELSEARDTQDTLRQEAFTLTNSVFRRSNPKLEERFIPTYDNYNVKGDMRSFILRERQREFYGEGKRWFDLVAYAYKTGTTSSMLTLLAPKFGGYASAVKAKLATMNSLFNPIYREEMKVNTALKQNPAWPDNESSERQ